jgi:hypothetical protein
MSTRPKKLPDVTEVTMREFRMAPAKVLRRAARTKKRVRVGDFLIAVEEAPAAARVASTYGCMRDMGRVVDPDDDLLRVDWDWSDRV